MQYSKRAVCFCLIENVTVHAYVYSNGTFFCNAASCVCPYHFCRKYGKMYGDYDRGGFGRYRFLVLENV